MSFDNKEYEKLRRKKRRDNVKKDRRKFVRRERKAVREFNDKFKHHGRKNWEDYEDE